MKKTILIAIAALFTVNVWGQNEYPTAVNTTVKIDGGSIKFIRPDVTGGWARGISFYDTDESTIFSSFGLYGSEETPVRWYLAHGDSPWSSGLGMYILTNGNVGIGTTTPQEPLHVINSKGEGDVPGLARQIAIFQNNSVSTSNASITIVSGTAGDGYLDFADKDDASNGWLRYDHNTSHMYLGTGDANRMTIDNNGKVGIGTTSPEDKLHITDGRVLISHSSNSPQLRFRDDIDNDQFTFLHNRSGNYLYLYSNETDDIISFMKNGNVGIGTTIPRTKLEIKDNNKSLPILGSSNNAQVRLVSSNNTLEIGVTNVWNGRVGAIQVRHESDSYSDYFGKLLLNPLGGNVGIGVTNPTYKLTVEGTIGAREVIVTNDVWSDFVFESTYNLMPLKDLDTYIQENKHLPEIPTTAEVQENGISVGEMNAKLLQKIEELTLHVIEQNKKIEAQNKRIENLEKK